MKKKVRKFISLLLSVMMVFSALPIHAFALESDRVKEAAPDAELSGTALLESIGDKNKNFFDPSDSELVQYVPDSSTNPSLVCSAEKFREQYVPYRKPTDILINDFHFSAEEAQAILNGTSTDSRIAYIGSESDLASRFNYSRGAEIVIITQDFEITKSISMDYPFPLCTFLAAEPKIISAKDRETYTKLIFGQEREYPLSDNTTLRFSNVIMDGVSLDFNASNELHGSYDPEKWPEETNSALVEGACTINTNHCIPAMEGLGTLSFLGCTAITAGTGINVGLNKEPVFATDCNLFTYGDNVYRGLSCFLLDGSIEISHSYITNGVEIKPFSDNTSTTNTVRAIGRNSIIKGYSTLYDTDVLLENVAVQSQDCSWCFSSRELGGNLNFNGEVPGLLNIRAINTPSCTATMKNVNFLSGGVDVYKGTIAVENCNFEWRLPLTTAGSKYSGLVRSTAVEVRGLTDGESVFDNISIDGYYFGIAYAGNIEIKNSNIVNNEYGIWRGTYIYSTADKQILPESLYQCSLNISSSDISNNSIAGIQTNNSKVSITDTKLDNNGCPSNETAGGIQFWKPGTDIIMGHEESDYKESLDETRNEVYNAFTAAFNAACENGGYLNIASTEIEKNQGENGGAISVKDPSVAVSLLNSQVINNTAASSGGAIYVPDYSKLQVDAATGFHGNRASIAYFAPENASELYPNIQFSGTSVSSHPLNNYDINYDSGSSEVPQIASLSSLEKVMVPLHTTAEELQAVLEGTYPQVSITLEDGTTVSSIPVAWNVSESGYTGENCAAYTIHGELNLSGKNYANASSLTADVTVYVGPIIVSNAKANKIEAEPTASVEEVQAQLEQDRSKVQVNLNVDTVNDREVPVTWKVSESDFNGNVCGTYTVYGDLDLTGITSFFNPEGYQAEIEVEVPPNPDLKIISVEDPLPITVKQYAMLSNEENKTTEFGSPTIFPRLPEKVTVNLQNGNTAELPAKWNIGECDTAQVGEQTITVYPICDGTDYWTSDATMPGNLKVTVAACDYLFMGATVSDITLEVLPGTTVEELNTLLKEEGKQELPLYMFDLDSGDQMITFYPLALKAEHCSNYQKDIPGEYDFIIPWPDNILPSEEDLPEIKVTVHVLEPLEIVDVELKTIEPYQSVPVGHESFPSIPSQVNVTLEGGLQIPVDVIWDWSTYNEDLAAEQLIIGKLTNLPSKAKQPEGREFTGKLKASVVPVAYEIKASLSEDPLIADAGLTLAEITQIIQPTLLFRISSVTKGIDLTLTRTVAVTLEDEKNPQFDPCELYGDCVTGTLNLPDNITYNPGSGFDQIPLFTEAAVIERFEPRAIFAREGVEFPDIPDKPDTVVAVLCTVGPDGENKKVSIPVDWGTGEGYDPNPPGVTDSTPVDLEITGRLVNKPGYIAATNKKPVLTVSVSREFDIEAISPIRIPETGEMEVPLGSSVEDIYNKLDQHMVTLTLKSTNGILSEREVSFELIAEENPNYQPAVTTPGSYTLIPHIYCGDHVTNPKGLQLEIHIKTMTYDIATAKVITIKGIAKGTAFEDIPLPETAGAVRDDGETEFLPTTWDGSKYNPDKTGGQFINGTFNTPLPLHLKNPDNRQPRAYIIMANTNATVLSMEQVFDEPTGIRKAKAKAEEIPGYVEHKYLLKLQYKDGTIKEEVISLYSEKSS